MYTELVAKYLVVRTVTNWIAYAFAAVLWLIVIILQAFGLDKIAEGLLIAVIVGFPCAALVFGVIAIKQFIFGEHPRSVLSPNTPIYRHPQESMPPWDPIQGYPDGSCKP